MLFVICFLILLGIGSMMGSDHHYFIAAVCFGFVLFYFFKHIPHSPKKTAVQPLKDSMLDRVKYVQIEFYDWNNHHPFTSKHEVDPSPRPGHYEFFIDNRIMVDKKMEKRSVELYDNNFSIIPLNNYSYSWDEIQYNFGDGDGGATLKVFPKR